MSIAVDARNLKANRTVGRYQIKRTNKTSRTPLCLCKDANKQNRTVVNGKTVSRGQDKQEKKGSQVVDLYLYFIRRLVGPSGSKTKFCEGSAVGEFPNKICGAAMSACAP